MGAVKQNQRAIDLEMVRFAYERAKGKRTHHWIKEDESAARRQHGWAMFLRDLLSQPTFGRGTLTSRQRQVVKESFRYIPEQLERIHSAHYEDDTPKVLRVLPKKPPGKLAG